MKYIKDTFNILTQKRINTLVLFASIIISVFYSKLLWQETPGVNGTPSWQYGYSNGLFFQGLYFYSLPFILYFSLFFYSEKQQIFSKRKIKFIICGISFIFYLLLANNILIKNEKLDYIANDLNTSNYFADATHAAEHPGWMKTFHEWKRGYKSSTQPAGILLHYYLFIKICDMIFGNYTDPALGGYATILFFYLGAGLSLPIFYLISRYWYTDIKHRIRATFFYTLFPALIFFSPSADAIYALYALLAVYLFLNTLHIRLSYLIKFIIVLFICFFTTYRLWLLTIIIFAISVSCTYMNKFSWDTIKKISIILATSAISIVLIHLILYYFTGYNAVLAFFQSQQIQDDILINGLNRPNSLNIRLFDLYDFACGSGIIPFIFASCCLLRRDLSNKIPGYALNVAFFIALLLMDFTGISRTESLRGWIYWQPFCFLGAGILLNDFSTMQISILFLVQWITLFIQQMKMFG